MRNDALTAEILDRTPPHDTTAEQSVLGSLLLEPAMVPEIAQQLVPDDFYNDANRRLFAHVVGLYIDAGSLDSTMLLDRLRVSGDLEAIGGAAYLAEVLQSVAVSAHAAYYAEIVAKYSRRRAVIHEATNALIGAYDDTVDPAAIASSSAERMLSVTTASKAKAVDTPVLFAQTLQDLVEPENDRPIGRTTGLFSFDQEIGGLYPGELAILAARPSMGKTALATQIALHSAEQHRHALFVSLETSAQSLAKRISANRAGVNLQAIRNRTLSDEDRRRLVKCNLDLPVEHLHLVDRSRMTTAEIRWEIMRRQQKQPVGLVVLDYLARLQPADPHAQRYLQIGQMTGDLKRLALEFDVPVLCLAQLGRAAEAKGESRPRLSHLRESGDIEQDADVVAFLYRPERLDRDDPDLRGKAWLYVEKNRNGPCGEFELLFDAPTCRFTDRWQPTRFSEFDEWGS